MNDVTVHYDDVTAHAQCMKWYSRLVMSVEIIGHVRRSACAEPLAA